MFKSVFTALILTAATALSAQAASVRPMGEINPTGTRVNNPGNWGRGYEFNVTAADVWLTELGHVTPSKGVNADYDIVLWDVATQTRLASVSGLKGTASATDWEFHSVAPIALTQGRNYAVTLYGSGNNESYYYTRDANYRPSGVINYVQMRYCNGCDSSKFGTNLLSGLNYGFTDIGYQIGKPVPGGSPAPVPLPAALPMLAAGLGLTGIMGRRRRKG